MKNGKKDEQIGDIQRGSGYSLLLITLPLIIVAMEASANFAFSASIVRCSEMGDKLSGNILTVPFPNQDVTFGIHSQEGCVCENSGGVRAALVNIGRALNPIIKDTTKRDDPEKQKDFIKTYAIWGEVARRQWAKALEVFVKEVTVRIPPGERSVTENVECIDYEEVKSFLHFYREWARYMAGLLDIAGLDGEGFASQKYEESRASDNPQDLF